MGMVSKFFQHDKGLIYHIRPNNHTVCLDFSKLLVVKYVSTTKSKTRSANDLFNGAYVMFCVFFF